MPGKKRTASLGAKVGLVAALAGAAFTSGTPISIARGNDSKPNLESVVKQINNNPEVKKFCDSGKEDLQKQRYESAIEHYQKALKIVQTNYEHLPNAQDFKEASLHVNLGTAYGKLGNKKEMLKHCSEALGLFPELPVVQYSIGICYWKLGKREQAMKHFTLAEELGAKADFVKTTIAKAREWIKENDIKIDPTPNAGMLRLVADGYERRGNNAKAEEYSTKADNQVAMSYTRGN